MYMSVTMEKPTEQDVVAEKVKSIANINRKKVVMMYVCVCMYFLF